VTVGISCDDPRSPKEAFRLTAPLGPGSREKPKKPVLFALLDGEISILATKIVNNIREVQSGVAIGVGGERQRALVPFDARGALVWVNVVAFRFLLSYYVLGLD